MYPIFDITVVCTKYLCYTIESSILENNKQKEYNYNNHITVKVLRKNGGNYIYISLFEVLTTEWPSLKLHLKICSRSVLQLQISNFGYFPLHWIVLGWAKLCCPEFAFYQVILHCIVLCCVALCCVALCYIHTCIPELIS